MKKIKAILILLVGALVLPSMVLAITVQSMAENIKNVVWDVAVVVVVIFWIFTGVLFLVALGSPEKVGTAKKALVAAIVGTIIVVLASSALSVVANAIGA